MSTFERVKKNIIRDMASSKTHTAASWANIMLQNTTLLTDTDEQKKFWAWIQNPYEDERAYPICDIFEEHNNVVIPRYISVPTDTDDEKSTVELVQECTVNGLATFIKVKPAV